MPYIDPANRSVIDGTMRDLLYLVRDLTPGECNYVITKIILAWEPERYTDMEAVLGRLEAIKQEFYRRRMTSYEDQKILDNGDVY